MEDIKKMLEERISDELKNLKNFETGSKERSTAIDDLAKLYRLNIDADKQTIELDEKQERRIMDVEEKQEKIGIEKDKLYDENIMRQRQVLEQTKDRYLRIGIATAEIVIPLIFYAVWMNKGFKFEESGTYTSTTFRGLFNRFKPTRR